MTSLVRDGKSLRVFFAQSEELYWYIHLSSTGWLMPGNEASRELSKTDGIYKNFLHAVNEANVRVKFHFEDGQEWHYHDSRTWGKWEIRSTKESQAKRGPDWLNEPLQAGLLLAAHKSKRTVKDVLCDQGVTSGLGNYLACEAAWRAELHPHQPWNTVSLDARYTLGCRIEQLLAEAMKSDDHSHWVVFDRAGKPCVLHPETKIEYAKDGRNGKRGSYFCPRCQPLKPVSP